MCFVGDGALTKALSAYEFAQILPTTRKRPGGGSLLVCASANVGVCSQNPTLAQS